jgi:peptidoglycan-N-acetylglucosamine deacetylase
MISTLRITFVLLFGYVFASGQEIALTFDDAPTGDGPWYSGTQRTELILNHLKNHRINEVAFFVITGNIDESGRKRLLRYANAGHYLANHTHSHRRIDVLGMQGYLTDIQKADSILRPMRGFVPWFRYPFLDEGKSRSARDSIRSALSNLQLKHGYVTVDNYDWYINGQLRRSVDAGKKVNEDNLRAWYIEHITASIEFYDKIAKEILGRSPKHVLLLHENDMAARYLGDLLAHLKNKGWKIISPMDAYQDPIAAQLPDVLFNGQGRVASIAKEKGKPSRELVQESEDEAYLDEEAKRKKVFE